jgi:hypothetical protein
MGVGPVAPAAPAATDRAAAPRPPHAPERHPLGRAHTRLLGRDMPLEFGKWETAYKRYRLWQRLLAALGEDSHDQQT